MFWSHCDCEDHFCSYNVSIHESYNSNNNNNNNNSTDHCSHWSLYGIDSLLLLINQTDQCNMNSSNQFLPDPYWDRYQFTDYFMQRKAPVRRNNWEKWNCPYPNSLLDEYHKASLKAGIQGSHFSTLFRIIQQRIKNMTPSEKDILLPPPSTLVIHLRLGDVIDTARDSVRELLFEQKYFYHLDVQQPWNEYVKPFSYYSDLLYNITKQHHYSSVVIMGSAHKGQQKDTMTTTKSCQYTKALQYYFERVVFANTNISVSVRIGQSPDQDIIFASQAAAYVPSGGSFSKIMRKLNQMNHAYQQNDLNTLNELGENPKCE